MPEASGRAEQVRAAAARARGAGAALRRRPLEERAQVLGALLEELRSPGGPTRERWIDALVAPSGFTRPTIERGLSLALADWGAEELRALAFRELELEGGQRPQPFPLTAVILAGAIPMPSVLSLVAPLLTGSPVVAKTARHDPVTATLVADALERLDPGMAVALQVVDFPSADATAAAALLEAGCVVAGGSDETLRALAAQLSPEQHFVAYGHRLSIAVVGDRLGRDEQAAVCDRLALDASLWDQLGCCSPVAVYRLGGPLPDSFAEDLSNAFAKWEAELPRGLVPIPAAARQAQEADQAELRGARVTRGRGFFLVAEADARWRPAPVHRFLRIHPVRREAELADGLAPVAGQLSSVAIAGLDPGDRATLCERLEALGASRICAPGTLQAPPLDWPRDGHPVLRSLVDLAG